MFLAFVLTLIFLLIISIPYLKSPSIQVLFRKIHCEKSYKNLSLEEAKKLRELAFDKHIENIFKRVYPRIQNSLDKLESVYFIFVGKENCYDSDIVDSFILKLKSLGFEALLHNHTYTEYGEAGGWEIRNYYIKIDFEKSLKSSLEKDA